MNIEHVFILFDSCSTIIELQSAGSKPDKQLQVKDLRELNCQTNVASSGENEANHGTVTNFDEYRNENLVDSRNAFFQVSSKSTEGTTSKSSALLSKIPLNQLNNNIKAQESKNTKNSDVWKFFVKKSDGFSADCCLCNQKVKSRRNTTNLHSHLKNKHPNVIEKNKTAMKRSLKISLLEKDETDESPSKKLQKSCATEKLSLHLAVQKPKSIMTQKRVDDMLSDQKSFEGKSK